jgi:hypothetical protein
MSESKSEGLRPWRFRAWPVLAICLITLTALLELGLAANPVV